MKQLNEIYARRTIASYPDLLLFDRPIAFHRDFVRLGIKVNGALFLSQALYWTKRTKDNDGWFYKTVEEWEEETGLTRKEQLTVKSDLQDKGIIEIQKRGIPAKNYFKVNTEKLALQLAVINEEHLSSQNGTTGYAETAPLYTESTTETTTSSVEPDGSPEYEPCYDDGFTKADRKDYFRNRRRQALSVAESEGWGVDRLQKSIRTTTDRPVHIISLYVDHKGMQFDNISQLQNEISRNLKTAHKLKHYTDQQITDTFKALDGKDYEWTLETVEKKINELKTKKTKFYNL